ncbi:hypothetical protein [Streptomyces chartreusis]|uniref:hypothetical protein n=1 Tax=Streptomyces chartreusis TaxID=1969 RepID=UPI0034125941
MDNAEDTEDTVHEYGHAVHHAQAPGFASSMETGSIGETFGDYPALAVDEHAAPPYGRPLKADVACCVACAADRDSVTHSDAPHCPHRINSDQTHADRISNVHTDSEIWPHALLDIHTTPAPPNTHRTTVNTQLSSPRHQLHDCRANNNHNNAEKARQDHGKPGPHHTPNSSNPPPHLTPRPHLTHHHPKATAPQPQNHSHPNPHRQNGQGE